MFIAHLPTGYILSNIVKKRSGLKHANLKLFMMFGMMGAIAPDLDMFYFYLVDHRQHHHHSYLTHYPIIWFSLLSLSAVWYRVAIDKANAILALVFTANGCLHLVLDTLVGDIWWFAPFIDKPYALFTVAARYQPWWLNFILHWSFLLELLICLWGLTIWRRNRKAVKDVYR